MLKYIKEKIIGSHSSRSLRDYQKILVQINEQRQNFTQYNKEQAVAKTAEFKQRLAQSEPLDSLIPEAFSLVRHAASQTLDQVHFDVQILGGLALHFGNIAEMKTGEGKTLTSTLPLYLNALAGKGAHAVTVNEYLAQRDSEWMGQIFKYLGLSVGLIRNGQTNAEKRLAYNADITYGTNNEFGFDYLRDNMKFRLEDMTQRELHYAIVDEVDSILIDEARTPLIISGPAEQSTEMYQIANDHMFQLTRAYRKAENPPKEQIAQFFKIEPQQVAEKLLNMKDDVVVTAGDYSMDEKSRHIQLSEQGSKKVEARLSAHLKGGSLYDLDNIGVLHHVNQALRAIYLFKRDTDYIIDNQRVKIVDEFTGRIMEGRRFGDGLHQALEAKESVPIQRENQTLATVTFQNYFRKYAKLAGMTGTALTEEDEFRKIYRLGVVTIPTNRKMVRKDWPDLIYKTKAAKTRAIIEQIKTLHQKQQPVLVGTDSIFSL